MIKSELIKRVSDNNESIFSKDISFVVDTIIEEISSALVENRRVELRGFGAFTIRKRSARKARNPKTNEIVQLGERNVPYFRAGKELKDLINNPSNDNTQ